VAARAAIRSNVTVAGYFPNRIIPTPATWAGSSIVTLLGVWVLVSDGEGEAQAVRGTAAIREDRRHEVDRRTDRRLDPWAGLDACHQSAALGQIHVAEQIRD